MSSSHDSASSSDASSADGDYVPSDHAASDAELSDFSSDRSAEEGSGDGAGDGDEGKKKGGRKKKRRKVPAEGQAKRSRRGELAASSAAPEVASAAPAVEDEAAKAAREAEAKKAKMKALWEEMNKPFKKPGSAPPPATASPVAPAPAAAPSFGPPLTSSAPSARPASAPAPPLSAVELARRALQSQQERKVAEDKVVVKQVFDYAGETVVVERAVDKDSKEAAKALAKKGNLDDILETLNNKKKMSTMGKSKLDWDRFKEKEGIAEELEQATKSKDSYLERQDFLERANYRQFELARDERLKRIMSRTNDGPQKK
jgi:hypothetical protein